MDAVKRFGLFVALLVLLHPSLSLAEDGPVEVAVYDIALYLASAPHAGGYLTPDALRQNPRASYRVRHFVLPYSLVTSMLQAPDMEDNDSNDSFIVVLDLDSRIDKAATIEFSMDLDGHVFRNGTRIDAEKEFLELLRVISPDVSFDRWFPWIRNGDQSSAKDTNGFAEVVPSILSKHPIDDPPNEPLDLLTCLEFFNQMADSNAVPPYCRVMLCTDPEALNDRHVVQDITEPGYLAGMDVLELIGLAESKDIRVGLSSLNMRQFLWLLKSVFLLEVRFTPVAIEIGYGWASPHSFAPYEPGLKQ